MFVYSLYCIFDAITGKIELNVEHFFSPGNGK